MTRRLGLVAALVALASFGACIQSLYPIYTDKDLVFEPALVGTWAEKPDSKETWRFAKVDDTTYELVQTDEGKTGTFVARLARVKGTLLLDLYPKDPELTATDYYKFHLRSVHSFILVTQIVPMLQMAPMDYDWLKAYLKKNPNAVRHEMVDEQLVLTAPTRDLQAFVLAHLKTKEAWGEPSAMTRVGL